MTDSARRAGVIVIENPHDDPVTVAFSDFDAAREREWDGRQQVDKLRAKLAKARAEVTAVEQAIAAAESDTVRRQDAVTAALAAVEAAVQAAPDLAVEVIARRDAAHQQQLAEAEARLARLKE